MFIGSNGLFGKIAKWIGNIIPNNFNRAPLVVFNGEPVTFNGSYVTYSEV